MAVLALNQTMKNTNNTMRSHHQIAGAAIRLVHYACDAAGVSGGARGRTKDGRTSHPQTVATRRGDSIVYGKTDNLGAKSLCLDIEMEVAICEVCHRIGEFLFQGQSTVWGDAIDALDPRQTAQARHAFRGVD